MEIFFLAKEAQMKMYALTYPSLLHTHYVTPS